jgi:hypothetical protein
LLQVLLKIAAVVDLARSSAGEVRGAKLGWAIPIALINSLGIVSITCFALRRRRPSHT